MKERGILFSGAMVRALLAGTKTQTRRVVRIDDTPISKQAAAELAFQRGIPSDAVNVRLLGYLKCDAPKGSATVSSRVRCPYGSPGDRLWVRETWALMNRERTTVVLRGHHREHERADLEAAYRATEDHDHGGWRPSLHMPRWASRITLEVTEVRVQRLQDIDGRDCFAELGLDPAGTYCCDFGWEVRRFRDLWDSINGDRAPWSANPWVWAVSFRRVTP